MRGRRGWGLVPILVGALAYECEARYGRLLAPYLEDPATLFVVSSDFCHWGTRFGFTFHAKERVRRGAGGRPGTRACISTFHRSLSVTRRDPQGTLPSAAPWLPWPAGPQGLIHESVEWLDRQGMALIEGLDPAAFQAYLQRYGNTICGRHPIAVFLQALQHCATRHALRFTKYAQSQRVTHGRESSVSYASAIVTAAV